MGKSSKLLWLTLVLLLVFPYEAMAYKVVVDPGHGGSDPGAIGVNGLKEKTVNLDISLKLRDELRKKGIQVVMTRSDDRYLALADRVEFTNAQKADILVSVHANSNPSSSPGGSQVLYYDSAYPQASYPASPEMEALTPYSKQLAQKVLNSVLKQTGLKDQGLVPSAVYVVRKGTIPSVLVETAFLSNSKEAAMLADSAFRQKMAKAIADGIAEFQPPVFADTSVHWAKDAILRMKNKGWMEGIGNLFEPNRALTRAEFVTVMDRVFHLDGLTADGPDNEVPVFSDLKSNHWSYTVMSKAVRLGLLNGYEDHTVRPNQPITRGEVAAVFQRLRQMTGVPTQTPPSGSFVFNDVPASAWYAPAVFTLKKSGIIDGVTNTEFKPNRYISRAEIAAMMDRYAANQP
ncbi:N-acetylmuramoyl-L-alanine amidase [Paenibacillus lutrae]|uniref:N-acetylmuramoyl-L-alanine amidase n=1 Tax=Paenibacillus lutrae TaxID=2078573 RepID=A0A7X3FH78_9BACL|nr:N-acetylmuramoyl-L-alanine amidase [Paenibacillus lutrae]MVO99689.1 N-acetylmuramoyl-L-alanine amidase [Paenibacillus lutrae]